MSLVANFRSMALSKKPAKVPAPLAAPDSRKSSGRVSASSFYKSKARYLPGINPRNSAARNGGSNAGPTAQHNSLMSNTDPFGIGSKIGFFACEPPFLELLFTLPLSPGLRVRVAHMPCSPLQIKPVTLGQSLQHRRVLSVSHCRRAVITLAQASRKLS